MEVPSGERDGDMPVQKCLIQGEISGGQSGQGLSWKRSILGKARMRH